MAKRKGFTIVLGKSPKERTEFHRPTRSEPLRHNFIPKLDEDDVCPVCGGIYAEGTCFCE